PPKSLPVLRQCANLDNRARRDRAVDVGEDVVSDGLVPDVQTLRVDDQKYQIVEVSVEGASDLAYLFLVPGGVDEALLCQRTAAGRHLVRAAGVACGLPFRPLGDVEDRCPRVLEIPCHEAERTGRTRPPDAIDSWQTPRTASIL